VPNDAVARTRALITFGSPLDKAAFIFRAQFNARYENGAEFREMLACAIQPLDHRLQISFRPRGDATRAALESISGSPLDIISGDLVYFDHPKNRAIAGVRW